MRWFALVLVLATAAGLLLSTPGSPPEEPAALDTAVAEWMARTGVEAAAALAVRGDTIVLSRTWGRATLDSELTIASSTKWVTAAVIMALVDRGALTLDDPVATWIPAPHGPGAVLTVRQLLSHTSGLDPKHGCIRDYEAALVDCARAIAAEPLAGPPGSVFRYGNAGYYLAAAAAEHATGQTWRALVQGTLGEPLGWTTTRYGRLGESPNPGVAGNLRTTPREFLAFLQMLLADGRFAGRQVLTARSVRLMETGQTAGTRPVGFVPARMLPITHDPYGFGVWREQVDEGGRAVLVSASGKYGFVPWIDRDRGVAAVFAAEQHGDQLAGERPVQTRVIDLLNQAIDGD